MFTDSKTFIPNQFDFQKEEKSNKLLLEKRKRSQAYLTLDYFLSYISYFDFFSNDAFQIALYSKCFTQSCQKKIVTSDFLLFPFFDTNSELGEILKEAHFTKNHLKFYLFNHDKKNGFFLFQKHFNRLFSNFFDHRFFDTSIKFSHEVNLLFEKASENALIRFKTPVITPEILLITLMEEKQSKAGKIIQKILPNPLDWYLLRYRLIKRIHNHEMNIRCEIEKNEHYFTYLLKTQLTELQFDRLIENNELFSLGVLYFRNKLILEILQQNLAKHLEKDISKSIKVTNLRKYSS